MENGGRTEEFQEIVFVTEGNHTNAADEIDWYVTLMDSVR